MTAPLLAADPPTTARGTIRTFDGKSITVANPATERGGEPPEVTYPVAAGVKIDVQPAQSDISRRRPGTADDVRPGERVWMKLTDGTAVGMLVYQQTGDQKLDEAIHLRQLPSVPGILTTVTADAVTIRQQGGSDRTFRLKDTRIRFWRVVRNAGEPKVAIWDAITAAPSDLKAGQTLRVEFEKDLAVRINIQEPAAATQPQASSK